MKAKKLSRIAHGLVACALALSLAACGSTPAPAASSSAAPSSAAAASSEAATPAASEATPASNEPVDLLAKYDPEIDLTAWRFLNAGIKFAEGEDIENNVYIDYYKEEFGINLKYAWVVPEEQFEQKLNISVASGDLPDLMWLNNKNLIELAENDLLYDLTDLYQNNLSDFTRSILEQDITSFNTAKLGGKLMAIPHTGSAVDSLQTLNVRTDWLDKLGLEVPTTMQELLAVAEAFTKNDPDGNGKNDTYGIAFTKNFLKDNHAGATGFFAGFHGYIQRWVDDGTGKLVYGSVTPQVREGLVAMQDMYKKGMIDPEFGVKDRAKVTETVVSGKVGITYGGMSTPGAFLKDNAINDPNAEWVTIELVSIDDKPAKPITKMPVQRYYAVSKESEHPEAIMKLIEAGSTGYRRDSKEVDDDKWELGHSAEGIAVFQYAIVGYEPALKNLTAHNNVLKAMEAKDTSILNAEEQGYYDNIQAFLGGNREKWGDARIFGTPSSFDIIGKYVDSGDYLYNAFYGSMTPTMVERMATLEAMEAEVFTKIIMGDPIENFDKFGTDWNNLGGADITKEVNDWAATAK